MQMLIVQAGDHTNKELLSVLVIASALMIIAMLLLYLKRKNGK